MTAGDWMVLWMRCAEGYRLQCTGELVLAQQARELERALEGRARDARRVVLPHLRKAMWLAARAERAHEHALASFALAYPSPADEHDAREDASAALQRVLAKGRR